MKADDIIDFAKTAKTVEPSQNGNSAPVFDTSANLKPNIIAVAEYLNAKPHYGENLYFDDFHKMIFFQENGKRRQWTDADDIALTVELQRYRIFERLSTDISAKAIIHYAMQHRRNEPLDWMSKLKWDGQPRIHAFFTDFMGTEKDAHGYAYAVGKNFWVSLAARIFSPGCKLYNMVVLEGTQGIGKTSALYTIGGDWYTEAVESVQNKDFFLSIQRKLIIEIAELDAFNRADVMRIKEVISCRTDHFRAPYTRHPTEHPRTCVFVGTTNDDAYLRDSTGGARFWPIRCGKIDLDRIAKERDQLFAEAVACFKNGDTWHQTPSEVTAEIQESRREYDAWEEVLQEKLKFGGSITMNEAAAHLGLSIDKLGRREQLRIASALRKLGYERKVARFGIELKKIWSK